MSACCFGSYREARRGEERRGEEGRGEEEQVDDELGMCNQQVTSAGTDYGTVFTRSELITSPPSTMNKHWKYTMHGYLHTPRKITSYLSISN